jgi:hypothetical protein
MAPAPVGLGGFLVQVLTAPLAIVANALTCLGSAFFLMFIKGQARATQPTERLVLRREIPEGIRFVFGHR